MGWPFMPISGQNSPSASAEQIHDWAGYRDLRTVQFCTVSAVSISQLNSANDFVTAFTDLSAGDC